MFCVRMYLHIFICIYGGRYLCATCSACVVRCVSYALDENAQYYRYYLSENLCLVYLSEIGYSVCVSRMFMFSIGVWGMGYCVAIVRARVCASLRISRRGLTDCCEDGERERAPSSQKESVRPPCGAIGNPMNSPKSAKRLISSC